MSVDQLTIPRPDDWHLHLRDGEALNSVAPFTAKQFARAIVMPNLNPPVTTVVMAVEYLDRVLAAVAGGIGGPMGFFAGAGVGAVELASPVIALACIGIGWAVMLPLLAQVAARLDSGPRLVEQSA